MEMFCPKCKKLTMNCQCKAGEDKYPVEAPEGLDELWWDMEQLQQRVKELELALEIIAKAHHYGARSVLGSGAETVVQYKAMEV